MEAEAEAEASTADSLSKEAAVIGNVFLLKRTKLNMIFLCFVLNNPAIILSTLYLTEVMGLWFLLSVVHIAHKC